MMGTGMGATQGSAGSSVGNLSSSNISLPTGFGRTHYMSITAFDSSYDGTTDIFDGNESWYADEVSAHVP